MTRQESKHVALVYMLQIYQQTVVLDCYIQYPNTTLLNTSGWKTLSSTLKRLRFDPVRPHVGSVAKTFILEESFELSNSAYPYKRLLVHIKQVRETIILSLLPKHSSYISMFICLFSWRYNPLWLYFHSPIAGFSLLVFKVSCSYTTTRHIRQDSSGRVINSSQRPLPDNTQHSQQTNIHASDGIGTHNLSRRVAEYLRLGPHGHWDLLYQNTRFNSNLSATIIGISDQQNSLRKHQKLKYKFT